MAKFKIYSKDGQTVRYEGCPKYSGVYLKVSYLEFSSIASPTPIAWQVGDYIDYPRTGLRYTLRAIPPLRKTAKPGQTGDAFTYQNVQFMAQTQDLAVAPFRDLVPDDNGVHFSTQQSVSTYENAYGIAARIQACLDDLFPGTWTVEVYEDLDTDFKEKISEAVDFSISGASCLEACDRMFETWGIGWAHYKDSTSGKDVLLFGRPNTRDTDNTTSDFIFGSGQGLTAIKRSIANTDELGTRLYVYGSTKNMLLDYYKGLDIYMGESVDVQNLMIPLSKWGITEGKPDAKKAYLEASPSTVEEIGLIPKTHYFDGSDGEEIYPTLVGMTIGGVKSGNPEYYPAATAWPDDSERVDEIEDVHNPEDDGYSGNADGDKYKDTDIVSYTGSNRQQVVLSAHGLPGRGQLHSVSLFRGVDMGAVSGNQITIEGGAEGFVEDVNGVIVRVTANLILEAGRDEITEPVTFVEENTDGHKFRFILPDITIQAEDFSDVSLSLYVYVTAQPLESNSLYYFTMSGYAFTLGTSDNLSGDFTLTLKQIGFDIATRASLTTEGLARIFMKDGVNAGRSFYVHTCEYVEDGDKWLLGMYRTEDESTGMRYPNATFPIKPGDHFVLLDIAMPDLYIDAAMQRLYDKGMEMLNDISRRKPFYEPEVDAKVMVEQERVLREGMFMRLTDADMTGGSSEYILIDTLTINEGDEAIPTYKVGLREYKKRSFQESTNSALNDLGNKVSGGTIEGKSTTGSSTLNYNNLEGKPSIDNVALVGDLASYDDLGLINKTFFELVNIGTEETPSWAIKAKFGLFSEQFISTRGADPEAGGGGGLDVSAMWAALASGTSEQINASHIPELSISKIAGLQDALDGKLSGITKAMVESVLTGTVTSHDHAGMYAPLSGGVIPSQYLPSYVDDVLEYASKSAFPTSGEAGKIYVALDTSLTYRWGGSSYVEISPSLALGYTSSTAYPGNEGAANASAIATLQGYFTGGAANKVAHALTISYDGGTAVKFDGSTALSVTIPSDAQRARWDKICALFDVDDNGDVHVTGNRGFWSPTFLSSRGSDPEAGQGGTGGLDIDAMWDALGTSGNQKIDASHIPALGLLSGTLTNAQLANSSIGVAGVTVPLGGSVTTAQIASALTSAGYKLTDTTYGLATDTTAGLVKTGYLTQVGTKNYGVKLNSLGQMYVSVPWTDTVTTLASLGITATAAEINKLDGLATTATELGYVHGVTSSIQAQLNAKANASSLAAYLPLAGGVMNGNIEMSGAGSTSLFIRMYADTSNYRVGIGWKTVSGETLLSQIGYWNTEQKIYINARSNEVSDIWQDAVGKYSLVVGKNLLTYNTYPLLHSGNYTSYTVTKTGGGASGTWGINISGSAGFLRSTYTGNGGLQPPSYFNGMGLKVNMMNAPVSFTDVIVVNGYGGSGSDVPYINALAFQKTAAAHGEVYHARGDYGGSSWGTWYKFLDEYNYATTLDTRYLLKSSYTAADVLAKLKTVDGSGSGLDADTLDGYQASTLSRLLSYIDSGTKTAAGWYRVFTANGGRTDALGVNIILHLARSFNHTNNEAYTFCISVAYDSQVNITQVSGLANVRLITKIRVVSNPSGALYIDFYLSTTTDGNTYFISGTGPGTFQQATAVSTAGGNVTEFSTVDGVGSTRGFTGDLTANGENGRGIVYSGNGMHICAANGGWAMFLDTYHSNRVTSFNHSVCGAYGGNGDSINYTYYGGTYGSPAMVILPNKNVGIGTTAPSYKLHVAGTIYATTGIWSSGWLSFSDLSSTSDRRFKDGIAPLGGKDALSVIHALKPSTWTWNALSKVKGRSAGFIAQDVAGILPDAIREIGEDKHLALNYQMLHAYEVAALQEHDDEIARLRKRVDFLEDELKRARSWQH